jgi:outer membrane protein TolC
VLAVLAPLSLASCAVGPDFTRPAVPWLEHWSADALQRAEQQALRQSTVQVDQWWREFGDEVLEQLVEEAQRRNPGVRTAGLRILEARAQLQIAGSTLYPQLQQLSGDGLWTSRGSSSWRSPTRRSTWQRC